MSATDILIKELANTINENQSKKPAPYDTTAEVIRIEGNTAWVHIPGGVDETPVQLTTNAKKGDIVQVRVSGGQAWITGNATNPPTDDTTAKAAQKTAAVADEHATDAVASAILAHQFADTARDEASRAKDAADTANGILDQMEVAAEEADMQLLDIFQKAKDAGDAATIAKTEAETASSAATSAQMSAQLATKQLSVVEDIIGVLELVSKNGVYEITDDTSVEVDKWYFTVSGTAVENPEGNPHGQGYYELNNGIYSLTDDITVEIGKTYYILTVSPVATPIDADIATYYELISIDDAIQNYISDHIVYMNGTLSLQNGNTSIALSTDPEIGLTFYNGNQQVARYGSTAVIGDPLGFHIEITGTELSFYQGTRKVAYISNNQLYITQSVVLEQMQLGQTVAQGGIGQWVWKVHPNANGRNNLNLKWNG